MNPILILDYAGIAVFALRSVDGLFLTARHRMKRDARLTEGMTPETAPL